MCGFPGEHSGGLKYVRAAPLGNPGAPIFVVLLSMCTPQALRDTIAANNAIAKIRDKERQKALKELGAAEVRWPVERTLRCHSRWPVPSQHEKHSHTSPPPMHPHTPSLPRAPLPCHPTRRSQRRRRTRSASWTTTCKRLRKRSRSGRRRGARAPPCLPPSSHGWGSAVEGAPHETPTPPHLPPPATECMGVGNVGRGTGPGRCVGRDAPASQRAVPLARGATLSAKEC